MARAWGWNGTGALGTGGTTTSPTPVAVSPYGRGTSPLAAYAYTGDGLRASKTQAGVTKSFTWDLSGAVPRGWSTMAPTSTSTAPTARPSSTSTRRPTP